MPGEQEPRVIVYQNADFVGSLYQSATNDGLPNSSEVETTNTVDASKTGTKTGKAGVNASVNIPSAKLGGELSGGGDSATKDARTWTQRQRVAMSRDIALYLHSLHTLLDESTRTVDSVTAGNLAPGDLVKFQGTFRQDPISALLDLCSPDAVAEVTRYTVRKTKLPRIDGDWDIERVKAQWEVAEQEATTKADLARTVTSALHTDFRRGTTTEFHCEIETELTALVACEAEHFVTADPDRPLDGAFTVFGKVITRPERHVPIFRKNKFLHRMNSAWVDSLFSQLTTLMKRTAESDENMRRFLRITNDDDRETPPPFDLEFPATIPGLSFTVLPIAIYA
ncbi:DUF6414 family protein [Amycolatopsis magusensis]|uniref:DUF6414 family protein n=1 Tax=Amycolatopsis magusensis TaxID=882444 RepID=UPI003788FD1E